MCFDKMFLEYATDFMSTGRYESGFEVYFLQNCAYTFRDLHSSVNAVYQAERMAFGTNTRDIPLASGQKYQMVNAVMRVSLS